MSERKRRAKTTRHQHSSMAASKKGAKNSLIHSCSVAGGLISFPCTARGEGRVESESFFNKHYTITRGCYNYTAARPTFEVADESWAGPRTASRCSVASYLAHVRPVSDDNKNREKLFLLFAIPCELSDVRCGCVGWGKADKFAVSQKRSRWHEAEIRGWTAKRSNSELSACAFSTSLTVCRVCGAVELHQFTSLNTRRRFPPASFDNSSAFQP